MVDALIKVIDRLIQLVEIRKRFNRQMFEDHIGPIYKDLQAVIDDYREIILDVENKLNTPGLKPEKVLEELITRRKKYARLRDEVKKYSDALANAKLNEDVYEFALKCGNLFVFEPTMPRPSPLRSALTSLIEDFAYVIEGRREKPRDSLSFLVSDYNYRLDQCWDDISSKYFQLRAEYLK
jgi:hypothetical protein